MTEMTDFSARWKNWQKKIEILTIHSEFCLFGFGFVAAVDAVVCHTVKLSPVLLYSNRRLGYKNNSNAAPI
jgi:hypothetical protein